MKATDARRHSPKKLEVLRERGFALFGRRSWHGLQMVSPRSRHRRTIRHPGWTAWSSQAFGVKLSAEQEIKIRSLLIEKNPKQLKFDFALWTRRAVKALIKRECQVELSLSTVGVYLRSWGMSVQRPALRAIEQDEQRVKQ